LRECRLPATDQQAARPDAERPRPQGLTTPTPLEQMAVLLMLRQAQPHSLAVRPAVPRPLTQVRASALALAATRLQVPVAMEARSRD
jgi:hypothetical protein